MTYVVSNLHGALDKYRALLDKIHFSAKDILYVLGDTADYGEDAVALLTEMSMAENVYSVAGEHDYRALRFLSGFDKMLRDGSMPDADFATEMAAWAADGGKETLDGFRALDAEMREGLLDYLADLTLYEEVEAGGKEFLLVHGGIAGFDANKALDEYEPEDFFADVARRAYFEDKTVVMGHTPTKSGKIEREMGVIYLDCGAKDGGAVACLCLETDEEFYV